MKFKEYLEEGVKAVDTIHNNLIKETRQQVPVMKHDVGRALQHYTGSGYRDVNLPLRKGDGHFPGTWGHEIDGHLHKLTANKTGHDFHVFRGFGGAQNTLSKLKVGDTFQDKGYTSTSLHKHIGSLFADNNDKHRVVARIHIKPGTKGFYAGGNSEKEFILHKGTHFKVVGHSQYKANDMGETIPHRIIHLEIHHQED